MSPLARLFYLYLLEQLLADPGVWVPYERLTLHFRPGLRLSWRGGPMHVALGELVVWCRERDLGLLPAIVVRITDGYPSDGFFAMAFPGVENEQERRQLWEAEFESVRQTTSPPAP